MMERDAHDGNDYACKHMDSNHCTKVKPLELPEYGSIPIEVGSPTGLLEKWLQHFK
jgi:hypothetical protein